MTYKLNRIKEMEYIIKIDDDENNVSGSYLSVFSFS